MNLASACRCTSMFLVALIAIGAARAAPPAAEIVPLWPQGQWKSPVRGPERTGRDGSATGAVSNISEPRLEIYRPERPNGSAAVIFGGGGYFRIQMGGAARPTALWLQSIGVTAAVVYYRLPGDGWSPVSPFQDGQRAMRLVRAKAAELGVDPQRIGTIGFSAGGNLAGITATRYDATLYPPVDDNDRVSARPDFLAMIYPVVSLRAPLDTTRSRRELAPQADAEEAYSVETHVRRDMPPVFLAQAADDPIANIGHSLAMFQAAHAAGVPVELHAFEQGGHSWGLGPPGSLVGQWPRLFAHWARSHGWFGATRGPAQPPKSTTENSPARSEGTDGN